MPKMVPIPQPTARRLRVYAFDPNASLDLGSAKFSHATIALAWSDPTEEPISIGPINEYLEVIDIDPASRQFYPPLDLNAPDVLGNDGGLPPSEGDPRFHQQMVFAVAMKTIKLFERALGRKVIWAPAWDDDAKTYVPTLKLRVYPHALREANAYYSRDKRALLFGYFNATQRAAGASWIFTVLSHDIIVHETTHAILDGLHPRYSEPTSVDSLAFHEAFADISALFSHFQLYEAVYDYIEKNAGHLDQTSLLSGLAGQFAKGTSGHPSLRDFIDAKPDANLLEGTSEPHDRGSILVAAVFDAFLSIYTARTDDLLRMCGIRMGATGPLHPDLVARLTAEATKSADHVLRMCIRALDYLPPVDVRFGEFLRAIVTADADLIAEDRLNYRLAFVEAFRRRGIFPENCLSMSPDNLLWDAADAELPVSDIDAEGMNLIPQYVRSDIVRTAEENRRKVWYWLTQPELKLADAGTAAEVQRFDAFRSKTRAVLAHDESCTGPRLAGYLADIDADLAWLGVSTADRVQLAADLGAAPTHFARWEAFLMLLTDPLRATNVRPDTEIDKAWERALGLFFQRPRGQPLYTIRGGAAGLSVEVASVRTTRRAGPDGQDIRQLVIEVTQRRQGFFDPGIQRANDMTPPANNAHMKGDFVFRGGATMIIDLRDNKLRYVISKRINDDARLDRQRQHLLAPEAMGFTYDPAAVKEPFAMLHRM
ncbi:hypothetical protein [Sphingomonas sp. UYP23]